MTFRLKIWPRYQIEYDGQEIRLSPLEGALLSRLASGRSVPCEDLIDSLYGDREDGGPDDPHNVIKVLACKLRKKLKPTPIRIGRIRFGELRIVDKFGKTINTISDKIIDEGMENSTTGKSDNDDSRDDADDQRPDRRDGD